MIVGWAPRWTGQTGRTTFLTLGAELQHRRIDRGWGQLRVQAAQGGAQAALEHHVAVVSPFGLGSIGGQLRAEGMAVANLLKPFDGLLFQMVFGEGSHRCSQACLRVAIGAELLSPSIAWLIAAQTAVAQILIRQLDERVVAILRAQAQRRGISLEQSLRDLLTAAAAEHVEVKQRLALLRRQTPAAGRQLDGAALIREGREQR